jgi:peptidoglycan hydrolase CwlO-like protein
LASFPLFEHISVTGYGLYPGPPGGDGLHIDLQPGVTLVLGANGLGKTTLVTMLYRLCTGPFDIPGLAGGSELGTRSTEARQLSRADRRLFAVRVVDDAAHAHATLVIALGGKRIRITRSLQTLTLTGLEVDDEILETSEDAYQDVILRQSGLPRFGDWILLLRHLTFYFESRRVLVWDPSAQRQILRLLCLPATTGSEWLALERDVLERDTQVRNLSAALYGQEASLARTEQAVDESDTVRRELAELQAAQEDAEPILADLNDQITELDSTRQAARLRALKAEASHESAYRDLERHQLLAIEAAFPTTDQTDRYLLAKLISDGECLACGSTVPAVEADLRQRISDARCVICGSTLNGAEAPAPIQPKAIAKATARLERAAVHLEAATAERTTADQEFNQTLERIQQLTAEIAERSARIDALAKRLPPSEAAAIEQREALAALRGRVEVLRAELSERRTALATFIEGVNLDIARQKEGIQTTFEQFAEGFLLDACTLIWSPHKTRVGQTGEQIEYPNFEVEMGGTDFPSPVRRSGPDQVSESQREFIDLAYRMTLMSVLGAEHAGSLVIDAPESSLDAVFVTRAADVLVRFANASSANRLLITSNLIEGDLVPELIRKADIRTQEDDRVIDLLQLAFPTAATERLAAEYDDVRKKIFARAWEQRD